MAMSNGRDGRRRPVLLAGNDRQKIVAERGEFAGDLQGRGIAQRHHQDDRADADDDAERGQARAQEIVADFAQRQQQRIPDHPALPLSDAINPSWKRTLRPA
jgi:hypothetical protein